MLPDALPSALRSIAYNSCDVIDEFGNSRHSIRVGTAYEIAAIWP